MNAHEHVEKAEEYAAAAKESAEYGYNDRFKQRLELAHLHVALAHAALVVADVPVEAGV